MKYAVGKLVPGDYKFSAQLTSKVYGVTIKIGGQSLEANAGTGESVSVSFNLKEETDVELVLVSTDPGEAGAGFTVAGAVVSLEYNFEKIKNNLTENAQTLANLIGSYNYAAKEEDVKAANALADKAQKIKESYDDYKTFELYATKSTIQKEIDALAAKAKAAEDAYQNEQAYNRVNDAVTAIKAKYNTAVAQIEQAYVGAAAYLLDAAKQALNEQINAKITEASQASYKSFQAGTAVADEAAVEAETPLVTADRAQAEVLDVEGAEGLEKLRVGSLHVELQGVGLAVVFGKQRLANLGNPLVGIGIKVAVDGLARPQGDVVQVDDVVVGAAIDECAELAVAYRQRLLEVVGGSFVMENHRWLLGC